MSNEEIMDRETDQSQAEFAPVGTSSIKLIRNLKGYGWEIKIYNEDVDIMLVQITKANEVMKAQYGDIK